MSTKTEAALAEAIDQLRRRVAALETANASRPRLGRIVSDDPVLEVREDGDTQNLPVAFTTDGSTPATTDLVLILVLDGQVHILPMMAVT